MKLRIVYDPKKYGMFYPYVLEQEYRTFWTGRPYWGPVQRCLLDRDDATFATEEDARKEMQLILARERAERRVIVEEAA